MITGEIKNRIDQIFNEIVEKTIAYNPTARQALTFAFQDQAYSLKQVYDFVWASICKKPNMAGNPYLNLLRILSSNWESIRILSANKPKAYGYH